MFGGSSERGIENVVALSSGSGADTVPDAEFWEAERKWQADELRKAFSVSVSEPQTVSSTFSSYTTYLVTSTLCPDGVRRRYSDFDWLHDVLVARYHGCAIPTMPEKRLVGNQGEAFIRERMVGLETYFLLLLSNPYLRHDTTLRMFLTQKGGPEFEQAKKAAAQGVGSDPASNAGLNRWFGVLRHLPLPADADAAVAALSEHVKAVEAGLARTLAATTKFHDVLRAQEEALRGLKESLAGLSGVHSSASDLPPALDNLKPLGSVIAGGVDKVTASFSSVHDLNVYAPNEVQLFLLDGLVAEVHRVRGLRRLIEVRDAALEAYAAAWTAQDKLMFQAKAFRDKGRNDKAEALEPKIAEAVGTMKTLKETLEDITKGLLNVEAARLWTVRSVRLRAMFGQYAALSVASGVRTQEVWAGYMGACELDQNAMVNDAQATLKNEMTMATLDAVGAAAAYYLPPQHVAGAEPILINGGGAGAPAGAEPTVTAPAPTPMAAFVGGAGAAVVPVTSSAAAEPERTVDL